MNQSDLIFVIYYYKSSKNGDLVITGSPAIGRCHQWLIQQNTLIH